MIVRKAKLLNGAKEQYQSLDEAIRTAQFIKLVRNVLGLLYPVSTVVAEKEKRRKAIPSLQNIVAL
jgi:putative transposase